MSFLIAMKDFFVDIINPIVDNMIRMNQNLLNDFFVAFIILLMGWLTAKIVRFVVMLFLKLIRFDTICDRTQISKFLENGGLRNIPSHSVGDLFYWVIVFVSFLSAVDRIVLGSSFQTFQKIVLFLPNALLALVILAVGVALGFFLSKIIRSWMVNAGTRSRLALVMEKILFVTIIIFSAKTALNIVKINDKIILIFVDNVIKFSVLGLAIAFGLGTKNFAEDFLAFYKIRSAFPKGTEIIIDGDRAIVKDISTFHTLLYTDDGKIIDLPNAILSRRIVKKVS